MVGDNYEEDIKLSRFNLEEELELLGEKIKHYGTALADAKAKEDAAYAKYKQTKALVSLAYRGAMGLEVVRALPEGITKTTDALVESLVEADLSVRDALAKLNKAKEDVYTFSIAVEALKENSYNARSLMSGFQAGYFTRP